VILSLFRRKERQPEMFEPATRVQVLERPPLPPTQSIPPAVHQSAPSETSAPKRRRRRGGRRKGGATAVEATTPTQDNGHRPSTAERPAARAPLSEAFRELGVDETGLEAIAALGFDQPTPIQAEALPLLLDGDDVVGLAQTGTGKTLAFGLPLARSIDLSRNTTQAVVLVPTRELANQVHESIEHLGKFYGFSVIGLVGGRRVRTDLAALEKSAQVVVGTPGRIIDHLERGTLSLRDVHFAVLDEADQMLDIGFLPAINKILRATPKERQTALFSATMPESIGRLVYRFMRDAKRVAVTPEQRTAEGVRQMYCEVAERDKVLALRHLYENESLGRSLIFRRTKIGVDRLTEQLQRAGVGARAIHGDLRQGERDRVMADFRSGKLDFLIATNVAARGLDIPDIEHVINYDVPQNPEEYIHRIGRTARAGKTGSAVTFVSEWELAEWERIAAEVGDANIEYLEMPARWD
jgi:ATP-dependent RNA helicase DeaD